ncbi:MAG: hypothetical protein IJ196_00085 [Prevotella sp.]|nr:hypothetical protein [Prevotella sp.]
MVVAGMLLLACSHQDTAKVAGQVARQYYEQLLKGDYESFVDGCYQPDAIPESYREQLVDNAKMFVGRQQTEHRGIKEVRLANAEADTVDNRVNAFLVFCYGDSTSEQVLVPMIEQGGTWYMR